MCDDLDHGAVEAAPDQNGNAGWSRLRASVRSDMYLRPVSRASEDGRVTRADPARRPRVAHHRGLPARPSRHPETPEATDLAGVRSFVTRSRKRPTAIDLFCGAGGLSLGLHRAGFDVLVGADSDEWAVRTHDANLPGLSWCGDLSDPDGVPQHARRLGHRAGRSRRRWRAVPALQPRGPFPDPAISSRSASAASTTPAPISGHRSSAVVRDAAARRRCWSRTCPTCRAGTTARCSSASTSRCARSATASRRASWTASGTASRSIGSG